MAQVHTCNFVNCDLCQIRVTWEKLTVSITRENQSFIRKFWKKIFRIRQEYFENTTILSAVSGYAKSGNMIAIMGSSGAGKTTFLAALSKKLKLNSGSVKINGCEVTTDMMDKISNYLPQKDVLPIFLTATEYLSFTFALKLKSYTSKFREDNCIQILRELGLYDCRNSLISVLSGGEKKRLSLAMEMITKPKILYLDEPTTGLDTFSAITVMLHIKLIALNGTIVFCTMHQPGMIIYNLFSHVLFLANGRTAYFGSLNSATTFFRKYFKLSSSQGFSCPVGFDESEYYVNILSEENVGFLHPVTSTLISSCRINKICDSYLQSIYCDITNHCIETNAAFLETSSHKNSIESIYTREKQKWIIQFYWLIWRIYKQNKRTLFTLSITTISYMMSISAIATFFMGINPQIQNGIPAVMGALYLMAAEIVFTVAYSAVYKIPSEFPLYIREKSLYDPSAYFISTIFGLAPNIIFKAVAFSTVIYFLLYVNVSLESYSLVCLCTILAAFSGTAYGLMISILTTNVEIATIIMTFLDLIFIINAGVYYNLRSLPIYLEWFKYISMFYYSVEALAITYWPNIDEIECTAVDNTTCLFSGSAVLLEYGYNEDNFWLLDIYGLILLIVIMLFIGFLGIRNLRKHKFTY